MAELMPLTTLEALERLGSMETFTVGTTVISDELKARIEYAREALRLHDVRVRALAPTPRFTTAEMNAKVRAEAKTEGRAEVEVERRAFPDDEGRRAWSLDLAVTLITGGRGLLGRDEVRTGDDEAGVALGVARRFYDFLQEGKNGENGEDGREGTGEGATP